MREVRKMELAGYRDIRLLLYQRFNKDTITLDDLSEYLNLSRKTVVKMIANGKIPAKKNERKYIISIDALAIWLASKNERS